jgi:hypothetical protein
MTSEIDIYRSATILVDKHGADAPNGNSFEHMPESARREWTARGKRVRASTTPEDGGAFDITEMELKEDRSVRSGPRLEHWGTER